MFQGIADQITEAQKEIEKQEALHNYNTFLDKAIKTETRKLKKIETALNKTSLHGLEPYSIDHYPSLKSFFFAVFEKQEKEKEKLRNQFIENNLYYLSSPTLLDYLKTQKEKTAKQLKANKEVKSLERIIKKIKSATLDKYYYQEVSTMFHFLDRSARINALDKEFEEIINMGEETLRIFHQIILNLKQESNWGSWEDYFSTNTEPHKIPPAGMDAAFEIIPRGGAMLQLFAMRAAPFIEGRDLSLHYNNLEGFLEAFIANMLYDWKHHAKAKTLKSKTNQTINSLGMVVYGIKNMKKQNSNEKALMEIEREKQIKKTEEYVKQKLREKP